MKAKDIRIGNWYNEFGIPKQASAAFILKLCQIELAGKIAIDVSPIELTEEWLLNLGFSIYDLKLGVRKFYNIGNLILELSHNLCAVYYTRHKEIICYIQYVHQLQNLYFALSDSELQLINK